MSRKEPGEYIEHIGDYHELEAHAEHAIDGPQDCPRCTLLRENAHWMVPGRTHAEHTGSGETSPRQVDYPSPDVLHLRGRTNSMGMRISWWAATEHTPEHYRIGLSDMSAAQVRAFAFQLLGITGWEDGAADAEILEAADQLIEGMGEGGSHITTTRSVLAMAAERARGSSGHPEGAIPLCGHRWNGFTPDPCPDAAVWLQTWQCTDGHLDYFWLCDRHDPGLPAEAYPAGPVCGFSENGMMCILPAAMLSRTRIGGTS